MTNEDKLKRWHNLGFSDKEDFDELAEKSQEKLEEKIKKEKNKAAELDMSLYRVYTRKSLSNEEQKILGIIRL